MDSASSSKVQQGSCAHCQKPATRICSGCQGCPDEATTKTVYCNVDCQRSDWPRHKSDCMRLKRRKALYRAADMLQQAWYVYQEMAQLTPIRRVEVKGDVISVWDGDLTAAARRRQGPFFTFPERLVKDERDKASVLTPVTCQEALRNLYGLAKALFANITSSVQECFFKVKNAPRRVVLIRYEGMKDEVKYVHAVWKVTSKSGEEFAIDTSGAQYGFYESIVPWQQFLQTRVQYIMNFESFGYRHNDIFGLDTSFLDQSMKVMFKMVAEAGIEFSECCTSWGARNRPLSEVLQLKDAEFNAAQKEFFAAVGEEFKKRLAALSRRYGLRLDRDGGHEYRELP